MLIGPCPIWIFDFPSGSHQLLLVTVENQSWIADVGFGSCCLRLPLLLTSDVVHEQGPERPKLKAEAGSTYILEAMLAGRWQDLYAFTLEPFLLADYEPYNYWNSTAPYVRWTQQKVCTIPTKRDESWQLIWSLKFTPKRVRRPSGRGTTRNMSNFYMIILAWRLRALSLNRDSEKSLSRYV